jgi:hypothetical protein
MAFLKGHKCERCGYEKVRINSYREENGEVVVDGATCEVCFKNVVLPTENYSEFVRQHGTRS